MSKPAISCSATWLAVTALLLAACQPRQGEQDKGKSEATPADKSADKGADKAAEPDPFAAAIAKNLPSVPDPTIVAASGPASGAGSAAEIMASLDNAAFRDRAVAFVREVAAGGASVTCTLPLTTPQPLPVSVWLFHGGAVAGRGQSAATEMCVALEDATRRAIAAAGAVQGDANHQRLAQGRFVVELSDRNYALVEHEGKGLELTQGLVPVRVLDKALLRRRIDEGKAYLLRVIEDRPGPGLGGVHKYYHAPTDSFENRVHTIYTASTIYTLLALHAHDKDESLREPIDRAAKFLLSMQSNAPGERSHGAFHYSFDLAKQEPEAKFVVGTTSKTIFTLIELHRLTRDKKYLDVARRAADWLLTMQRPDGRVSSYLRKKPSGSWVVSRKESMLYTGQVLSALSRLYEATRDTKYLGAASHTARYLANEVASKGCYLGDDYRKPNPISSSWALLSLFDFARASGDAELKQTVYRCASELMDRQIRDPDDVYRHGRWRGSLSSSGNGWLAEVLAVLYLDCKKNDPSDCARLHDAIVHVIRLLMQYTYSPESSFVVRNPERARGGVFWNTLDRYVRTDSVCHAMNAYVFMIDHLADGALVEVPEPPLAERLRLQGAPPRPAGGEDEEATPDGEDEEGTGPGDGDEPGESGEGEEAGEAAE
jgi:hypothetical protein